MNDLLAGNLDFVFMDSASALAQIREGRLKALAVSTPTRSALAPDIPTMAEAGFPGIDRIAWFGAVLPKDTPDSIASTFNGWIQTIWRAMRPSASFRPPAPRSSRARANS